MSSALWDGPIHYGLKSKLSEEKDSKVFQTQDDDWQKIKRTRNKGDKKNCELIRL